MMCFLFCLRQNKSRLSFQEQTNNLLHKLILRIQNCFISIVIRRQGFHNICRIRIRLLCACLCIEKKIVQEMSSYSLFIVLPFRYYKQTVNLALEHSMHMTKLLISFAKQKEKNPFLCMNVHLHIHKNSKKHFM